MSIGSIGSTSTTYQLLLATGAAVSARAAAAARTSGGTRSAAEPETVDSLSALLGTDATSLLTELRSGTSLSDLLAGAGVDPTAVAGVIQEGIVLDTTA